MATTIEIPLKEATDEQEDLATTNALSVENLVTLPVNAPTLMETVRLVEGWLADQRLATTVMEKDTCQETAQNQDK